MVVGLRFWLLLVVVCFCFSCILFDMVSIIFYNYVLYCNCWLLVMWCVLLALLLVLLLFLLLHVAWQVAKHAAKLNESVEMAKGLLRSEHN